MQKHNLSTTNIVDFKKGDTIYIPEKTRDNNHLFLCEFISYNEKNRTITGKVIEATVNEKLYTHKIEQGWELNAPLLNCCLYGEEPSTPGRGYYHHFNSIGYALDPEEEYKIIQNEMHVSKHPSFGVIHASRQSGGNNVLFGSSVQHSNTISIKISTAEHTRDGNYDHIHDNKQLIEVQMSQTQFAEFITSMNVGSGIPCTIKAIDYKRISDPPFKSKNDIFHEEFSAKMYNLAIDMRKLVKDSLTVLNSKPTLTKGDKDLIIKSIESLSRELNSNIPHMQTLFREQMDKTILEAKNEVEAFIDNKIRSTGILALNDPDVVEQLKLNSGL